MSVSFAIVESLVSHEIGKGQGLSELLTALGRRSHGDVEAETTSLTLYLYMNGMLFHIWKKPFWKDFIAYFILLLKKSQC